MKLSYQRLATVSLALGLTLVGVSLLSVTLGSVTIPTAEILSAILQKLFHQHSRLSSEEQAILFDLRIPRIFLAVTVGMALSVAGASFQALLRNPLADPHVLGVSSGAALGAIISIILDLQFTLGTSVASFLGALITIVVVYFLGTHGKAASTQTLLLAGIVTSSFLSAAIIFLQTYLSGRQLQQITFWLLGDFSSIDVAHLGWIFLAVMACILLIALVSGDLNVLITGELEAQHLGVNVKRLKRSVYLLAALLTGLAVSISGSIGYMGLLVPHIVRMAFGNDYRLLIPASALAGASFAVLADVIARTALAPAELPVGAITALTGAPMFIYLLRRTRWEAV
ncbi:MAG: iron ABC transporter permease [Acidobacteriota bacterium]